MRDVLDDIGRRQFVVVGVFQHRQDIPVALYSVSNVVTALADGDEIRQFVRVLRGFELVERGFVVDGKPVAMPLAMLPLANTTVSTGESVALDRPSRRFRYLFIHTFDPRGFDVLDREMSLGFLMDPPR